jgi:hypothetical protein
LRRRTTPATLRSEAAASPPPFVPPYPPSWFDRLKRLVERLPGPFWLAYLVLWIGLFAAETLLHWFHGDFPVGTWKPIHAVLMAFVPGGLCLIHALDRLAERSFDSYQPVIASGGPGPEVLRYQLTRLPRRPAALVMGASMLVGGIIFVWAPEGRLAAGLFNNLDAMQVSRSATIVVFTGLVMAATLATVGLVIYHTIRQLRWVSRIYTRWTNVDLLKPGPLYSLSRLSAGTSLGLVFMVYVVLAADRAFMHDTRNVFGAGVMALLAVLAFILPLLGVHRAQAAEKERLLDETADRLKAALRDLHRRVDAAKLGDMDALHKAIASLEIERNLLSRIPTWPWQPETLRTVIVALLLPLILWSAQALLGRILPP